MRRETFGTLRQRPALDWSMRYVLVLLMAVTMACGAATSVTISLAPSHVADNGGY